MLHRRIWLQTVIVPVQLPALHGAQTELVHAGQPVSGFVSVSEKHAWTEREPSCQAMNATAANQTYQFM